MKKIVNKINMALVGIMVSLPAFAAFDENAICKLMDDLGAIFRMLRTFCFIGAAFMIAGWAWGYISSGKVTDDPMKELKTKGTALLIGFFLLFGVALVFQFLTSATGASILGCVEEAFKA